MKKKIRQKKRENHTKKDPTCNNTQHRPAVNYNTQDRHERRTSKLGMGVVGGGGNISQCGRGNQLGGLLSVCEKEREGKLLSTFGTCREYQEYAVLGLQGKI